MFKRTIALTILSGLLLSFPLLAGDIFKAAGEGNLQKVKEWVAQNPKLVNARSKNLSVPLHFAASKGHLEVCKYLVQKGADINALDVSNRPPIVGAAYSGYVGVVKYLLDRGARLEIKDNRGYTAYQWAALRSKKDVVDLFLAKGARISIHDAAACGHDKLVKKFIAEGVDVRGQNPDGQTPFHLAVRGSHITTVDLLLKNGIDVNIKNGKQETALDMVYESENNKMIEYMKKKGGRLSTVQPPQVVAVKPGIYRICFPFGIKSNIGVKVGKTGVLLVDTGFMRRAIPQLRRQIKKISSGEIKIIINSHSHWDHVRGNDIAAETTTMVGLRKLEDLVKKGILRKGEGKVGGDTGFDTYYHLNFSGEAIKLIPYPGVHSGSDLLTYFSSSGVVHMGDLLLSESFPAIGRNIEEYLAFLNKVIRVFPEGTVFISGHGRELDLEGVIHYRDMLLKTIAIVKKGLAAGKSLAQLKEGKVLADFASYETYLPFLNMDYWIGAIYSRYKDTDSR